jgi:hypothetical protein
MGVSFDPWWRKMPIAVEMQHTEKKIQIWKNM